MSRLLLGMLMAVTLSASVSANADHKKEWLEFLISGKEPAAHYLEEYRKVSKMPLPELRQVFRQAVTAFLNTWEPNSFSALPAKARLDLAKENVRRYTDSLFASVEDGDLRWALRKLAVAMRREAQAPLIDAIAGRVVQNVFAEGNIVDERQEGRQRAFSDKTLERYRQQVVDELMRAVGRRDLQLHKVEVQDELVVHLSELSCLRFGLACVQRKIASFGEPPAEPPKEEEEYQTISPPDSPQSDAPRVIRRLRPVKLSRLRQYADDEKESDYDWQAITPPPGEEDDFVQQEPPPTINLPQRVRGELVLRRRPVAPTPGVILAIRMGMWL
jgi:hypothetical protein